MSGSSSGGGQSGKVEYSAYLEAVHLDWLGTGIGGDAMTTNIAELMETAQTGGNPYTAAVNSNPDTVNGLIDLIEVEVAKIVNTTATLDEENDWDTFNNSITTQIATTIIDNTDESNNLLDDTTVNAEIAANDAIIDSRITTTILPRFQAGMQDINAVVGSAFVIGKSNIETEAQLDKDKFGADIRLTNYNLGVKIAEMRNDRIMKRDMQHNEMIMTGTKDVIGMLINRLEYIKIGAHYTTEANRIIFVMRQEYEERVVEWDEKDTVWDMTIYQYGANVMAGITGAAATTRGNQPSTAQKVLGGALSGVAAGAAVGSAVPGIGTAVGAVAGGVIGLASSFL